jgi:hypothetical protein
MQIPAQTRSKVPDTNQANPRNSWQQVYKQLELNKIANVTSYQVNGNLFIVVPIEE